MRASGRGGRQGPRGDPVPASPSAFMGMCARKRLSLAFDALVFAYGASLRIVSWVPQGFAGVLGVRQTGASNLLSFITWLFSAIFF